MFAIRPLKSFVLTSALLLVLTSQSVGAQSSSAVVVQNLPASSSTAVASSPLYIPGSPIVKRVQFTPDASGVGLLRLEFEGSAPSVDLRQNANGIILDLGQTPLREALSSPFLVNSNQTPVRKVSPLLNGLTNQISIDTYGDVDVRAFQTGLNYVVEIASKKQTTSFVQPNGTLVQPQTAPLQAPKRYEGRPVTFNFQDVPVRTVLQLIAEESGLNIVASDTVQGNVTLRLVNVPWEQALDLVLQSKGLDQRRDGKVIWIAPQPELAKFEQDKEDARIALDQRVDLKTEYIQINYHSAEEIFKGITEAKGVGGGANAGSSPTMNENSFLSPRGRLIADKRTNTLMISDIPKKIEQLRELVSMIDRPVDQVLIEGRIVIATDTFARDLGARFGVTGTRQYGGNTAGIDGGVNLPAGGTTDNGAASLAYTLLGRNFSLDVELSALQEEGKGEVISNPRLITSNQREGIIRQGKEVGYVTITGGTNGTAATPNVQFKEALLELKVTPTITNDNRVFLNLNLKKDEIESYIDLGDYGAVPQFNKREINTAVLLEDGQTLVIGGVYEFTDRESVAKVPFLGDVPFLGNLFKKRGKSKNKAELLVFITPKVMRVAPSSNGTSSLPAR